MKIIKRPKLKNKIRKLNGKPYGKGSIKNEINKTSKYFFYILIAILLSNCAGLKKSKQKNFEEEILSLNLSDEELQKLKDDKSNLINDIIQFRRANKEEEIEIMVVKDFLSLEECRSPEDCEPKDLPNKFQIIFDFYKTKTNEKLEWLKDEANRDLKNVILYFLIENADN